MIFTETEREALASKAEYSIQPAAYAKGQLLIKAPSTTGLKSRAARLLGGLKGRWTNRERGYVVSPAKAKKFEKLFRDGWDADIFGTLEPPTTD